jgi:hypothetical protein
LAGLNLGGQVKKSEKWMGSEREVNPHEKKLREGIYNINIEDGGRPGVPERELVQIL